MPPTHLQDPRPALSIEAPDQRPRWLPVFTAIATFAALSTWCSIKSQGFIAGDACMHYLSARYAFSSPQNFLDVWNRPVIVALYAVPAWFGGRPAVRAVCMMVAIACALVAQRIARRQGTRWPVLAVVFTLGQPMLFLHSFGEMAELPFALLLGLAFFAYQSRMFALTAAIVAWLPLVRPEGFGIMALLSVALLLHRRPWWILLLPIPLLFWDVTGWHFVDSRGPWWRWLYSCWPYAGRSLYGHGQILALAAVLPVVVSPLVMPAMLVGIWRSWRRSIGERSHERRESGTGGARVIGPQKPMGGPPMPPANRVGQDGTYGNTSFHLRLCILLTALLPLFILMAHSVLYWLGDMGSFGEARYLLVVAPLWGVLSARGWEWLFDRFQWNHPIRWAAAAVLLPPILANAVHPVVPIPLPVDWQIVRNVAEWYQHNPDLAGKYPRVMAAHPAIFYDLDINPYGSAQVRAWDLQTLHEHKPGTLLIWDPVYGNRNSSADRAFNLDEVAKYGWIELKVPQAHGIKVEHPDPKAGDVGGAWHIFVSPEPVGSSISPSAPSPWREPAPPHP